MEAGEDASSHPPRGGDFCDAFADSGSDSVSSNWLPRRRGRRHTCTDEPQRAEQHERGAERRRASDSASSAEEHDERAEARRRHKRDAAVREDYRERHWERVPGKGKNKRGHQMHRGSWPMQTLVEGEVPGWKVFIGDLPKDMTQDSPG